VRDKRRYYMRPSLVFAHQLTPAPRGRRVAALAGVVSFVGPGVIAAWETIGCRSSGGATSAKNFVSALSQPIVARWRLGRFAAASRLPATPFKRSPRPRCLFVQTAGGVSTTSPPRPTSPQQSSAVVTTCKENVVPLLGTHRLSDGRQIRRRLRAGMLGFGVALIGVGISAAPAAAATYQVPTSIAGDCSLDVTSALQSWIGSVPNGSTLSFGTNACYRIERTLHVSSRTGLDFEGNGSTFESFNAPTDARPVWQAWQSSALIFRNMNVVGSYARGGTFTSGLQHSHGFDLRGTGAEIANVSIKNVAGDCVYFGLGSDGVTRSTGSFHNSSCSGISRNGVSVTAGNNILVQYVTTDAIGYDVFDVEPNATAGNWGAQRVAFDSNRIGSYALSAYSVVENAPISSQSFANNTVTRQGLKITVGGNGVVRPQGITITGNSSNTAQAPAAMNLSSIDGLTITGNTVPLTSGTMASVDSSCTVNITSNSYPGGSSQDTVSPHTCHRARARAPRPRGRPSRSRALRQERHSRGRGLRSPPPRARRH
jgi:hypothetical protein